MTGATTHSRGQGSTTSTCRRDPVDELPAFSNETAQRALVSQEQERT